MRHSAEPAKLSNRLRHIGNSTAIEIGRYTGNHSTDQCLISALANPGKLPPSPATLRRFRTANPQACGNSHQFACIRNCRPRILSCRQPSATNTPKARTRSGLFRICQQRQHWRVFQPFVRKIQAHHRPHVRHCTKMRQRGLSTPCLREGRFPTLPLRNNALRRAVWVVIWRARVTGFKIMT